MTAPYRWGKPTGLCGTCMAESSLGIYGILRYAIEANTVREFESHAHKAFEPTTATESGSHTNQAGFVLYLHRHHGINITKIADQLRVLPTNLDHVVQDLIRKRLIRRQTHPKDSEFKWVLTAKAVSLVPDIAKHTGELSTAIREVSRHPHDA